MYQNCNLSGMGTFTPYPYPTVLPSYQAPQQLPAILPGKVVEKLEDIHLSDVPMNGTPSIFPLQDDSAIIVKSWNTDGTVKTLTYVLETDKPHKEDVPIDELKHYIDERFNRFEKEVLTRG